MLNFYFFTPEMGKSRPNFRKKTLYNYAIVNSFDRSIKQF